MVTAEAEGRGGNRGAGAVDGPGGQLDEVAPGGSAEEVRVGGASQRISATVSLLHEWAAGVRRQGAFGGR
jgi:hypothetical protein